MISLTSPVRTRAHGWPAGAKLAGLAAATTGLFLLPGLTAQVVALALTLGLYALPGRAFLHHGLRQLRILWPFVLILALWHLATGDGPEGLRLALRLVSAVALANLVTMTTSLSALTELLHRMLGPLRRLGLPTALIQNALPLAIRFTPVLIARAGMLGQAWRARSARRANWRIALPMALLALDDADRVAEAIRARGGMGEEDGMGGPVPAPTDAAPDLRSPPP
ncbi:MAG: energy-coupling factor transporter transmembrane component T [Paracoccus sp. (in: a-proteobacteria)]|uniref:CbiQ family ECF transporter T component n=1 Tax=Paracoccus sp. TaxID=267 RepID=UPI0039E5E93E